MKKTSKCSAEKKKEFETETNKRKQSYAFLMLAAAVTQMEVDINQGWKHIFCYISKLKEEERKERRIIQKSNLMHV